MSLKAAAVSGAKWTTASGAISILVQFAQIAVLARLLTPEDFGLMAMIMVVIGFAQIYADAGISSALIYRQDTMPEVLSSLYLLSIFFGLAIFVVALIATPLVAFIFSEPRLISLIPIAATLFLITPFGQQFKILLQRDLRFRELGTVEATAAVAGAAVAIVAAALGLGVLSLIIGQLTNTFIATMAFIAIGWRQWRPFWRFRTTDLKGFLSFGLYQMGEKSVNFVNSRTDQFLIGVLLGPHALGLYNLAWSLVIQPVTRINPILVRVAFPLFAKVQTDRNRLRRGYMFLTWILAVVNGPLLIGFAAISTLFIPVFLGDRWNETIAIVQVLAFVSLLRSISNPVGALFLATGRADLGFKWNVLLLVFQSPAILLGAHYGGLMGVAVSVLAAQAVYMPLMYIFLIRRLLGPCLKDYMASFIPVLAISTVMGLAVLTLPEIITIKPTFTLAAQIALGVALYVGLCALFLRPRMGELRRLVMP